MIGCEGGPFVKPTTKIRLFKYFSKLFRDFGELFYCTGK